MPECFAEIEGNPKLSNIALIKIKRLSTAAGMIFLENHSFFEGKKGFFMKEIFFLLRSVTVIEEQLFWR